MKKSELLNAWKSLKENQELQPATIPYKHEGSTYTEDGIRVCGTEGFILSVLSHLKGLLEFENGDTRVQVSLKESTDKKTREKTGSYCCYIQVHERGPMAKHINEILGK